MRGMFRSLGVRNFRLWTIGIFISSVGSWMQMTAQDWLVLTQLTDQDAVALGTVIALQFIPMVVVSPLAGIATDRWNPRSILLVTQAVQFTLAVTLGAIVLVGVVELWHVYVLAFVLGCIAAFDGPARNTFIAQLVSDEHLSNGISLTSAAFNCARLLGPAVAGIAIAAVGSGWVFIINALTFVAVIVCLLGIRVADLVHREHHEQDRGGLVHALVYVRRRPEIIVLSAVSFLVGMFSLNAAIFSATMARIEFDMGAEGFGLLATMLGLGAMVGSLISAAIARATLTTIAACAGAFAVAAALAAVAPTYGLFAIGLAVFAVPMLMVMVITNARVQLVTAPGYRGRVIGLYMAVFMMGAPVGGPILGVLVNTFGPRSSLFAAAIVGLVAAAIAGGWDAWQRRRSVTDDLEPAARVRVM